MLKSKLIDNDPSLAFKEKVIQIASRPFEPKPSFEQAKTAILEGGCWVANEINSMTWKDLELEIPVISTDKLSEITGGFNFGNVGL